MHTRTGRNRATEILPFLPSSRADPGAPVERKANSVAELYEKFKQEINFQVQRLYNPQVYRIITQNGQCEFCRNKKWDEIKTVQNVNDKFTKDIESIKKYQTEIPEVKNLMCYKFQERSV